MRKLLSILSLVLIFGGNMTDSTDKTADLLEKIIAGAEISPSEIQELRELGNKEESIIGTVSGS